jgi:hypothetical protein
MSDPAREDSGVPRRGPSIAVIEVITAAVLFAVGAVVIHDSRRLGAGWAPDGPQSGYFPFYIGLVLCLSCVAIIYRAWFGPGRRREAFVDGKQLKQIFSVLLPATAYVGLIHVLGIYVASALYVAVFMIWLGRYPVARSVALGVSVSVVFFLTFEKWFAVPLPKGPVERLLGF